MLLSIGQPLWSVYDPASPSYWGRAGTDSSPLFSMQFANPLYFALAAALTCFGSWRRVLSSYEVALAVALLLLPYLTRAYEMGMDGMARFACVVFPVYIVLGHILHALPWPISCLVLAFGGCLLAIYAALFAAGHPFI